MKPLESLERIKNAPTIYVGCASDIYTRYSFECKEIEKELKALEIIKRKGVAVGFIQMLQKNNLGGVNEYNDYIGDPKLHLTPEEYNLLKEVLSDER